MPSAIIFPTITAQTTAVLIILQALLMLWTALGRRKLKVAFGVGGEAKLEKRIRAHGNLAENSAIVLIALALLEMGGQSQNTVTLLAGAFVVVRVAHIIGVGILAPGANLGRVTGTMGTFIIQLICGGLLIKQYGLLPLGPV